jgi:S1-C subfamily serine protease
VRGVVDGSPAARAGVQRGDLMVRAGDRELHAIDDLFDALEGAGESLKLSVVRGEEEREVGVQWG